MNKVLLKILTVIVWTIAICATFFLGIVETLGLLIGGPVLLAAWWAALTLLDKIAPNEYTEEGTL